jgi:hypothetical protein
MTGGCNQTASAAAADADTVAAAADTRFESEVVAFAFVVAAPFAAAVDDDVRDPPSHEDRGTPLVMDERRAHVRWWSVRLLGQYYTIRGRTDHVPTHMHRRRDVAVGVVVVVHYFDFHYHSRNTDRCSSSPGCKGARTSLIACLRENNIAAVASGDGVVAVVDRFGMPAVRTVLLWRQY